MESGKLRHVIEIQSKTDSSDGQGGITETWTEFVTTRCSVLTNAGNEKDSGYQTEARATHEIRMRYYPSIDSSMRALFNGRVLNFIRVDNVKELNKEIRITAIEEK
jgi:SPP1 family predicted phage head-tail adaptor